MTHQETIWVVATVCFASTFGVFATIRYIKLHTRPPVNTLVRSGDIELVDYIEPSRPQQIYNYPDLLESHGRFSDYYERISNYGRIPSQWSGTPPSYQTVDRGYINSCLENENIINSDFIFVIFMFMFFLKIFWKMNSLYTMSILIPFSLFEIDFRDSFEWKFDSYGVKAKISYIKLQTLTKDIIKLLDSLKDDENYSMGLSFIPSYKKWQDNKDKVHPLFIDNPIIINKESDPIIITQFIMNKLNDKAYFVSNWLFKDSSINSMDPVILTVTIAIKVKI
jgi:hypothetical protein